MKKWPNTDCSALIIFKIRFDWGPQTFVWSGKPIQWRARARTLDSDWRLALKLRLTAIDLLGMFIWHCNSAVHGFNVGHRSMALRSQTV